MELKEAMETATAELDVRPGFVGDVMAGARRRHTRKLLAVTAAVALLAGVTSGVVLTRSSSEPPLADDVRLTAAIGGDLADQTEFIQQSLTAWTKGTAVGDLVTEVSPDAHVFWAGNTQDGRVSLIAQSVRVPSYTKPQTLVGLVRDDTVVDQEIVYKGAREQGIYRLGSDENATYVVLSLGQKVFWSVSPVRGQDLRYSRKWHEASFHDGVAVVSAKPTEKPVFIRTDNGPPADDVNRVGERILPRQEMEQQKVMQPHTGLGWRDVMWASARQEPSRPGSSADKLVAEDLMRRGYLDYDTPYLLWEVRAWLPDGRFAVVTETNDELVGALYQPDGTFDRVLPGGPW
ncbi:hypothetical protein FXN61_20780 [Lentzea sp. PSKA42]|uniref:Sigma E regulatory protein, MucB/RseB n=1 Tax=Lentzea indica TaxID=2604800 RepID=A0ABX1FJL8_9PSEU|nr:hypothetical protein [Lentzea indica]NKE59115.1 hypothetical protein [Lentzea indica]